MYMYYHFPSTFLENVAEEEKLRYRKKRYENYQKAEPYRRGPGEQGERLVLTGEHAEKAKLVARKEAFNLVASDMIALDRSLRDIRDSRYQLPCQFFLIIQKIFQTLCKRRTMKFLAYLDHSCLPCLVFGYSLSFFLFFLLPNCPLPFFPPHCGLHASTCCYSVHVSFSFWIDN
ncbi:GALNT [Acanthosepion pharaonis]|uniref:GALNT n=1 Tax=Acanthosepion pharaonis TaxID=158019 RepID=A0A812D6Q8_ACAPH|nr:GALNT [Sepia pharaonis]